MASPAFFASGDTGVANVDKQGQFFSYPTVNYPASSPNVVSVGGTEIDAPAREHHQLLA